MATEYRDYTEIPGSAVPDVPYRVNLALREIDADVHKVETEAATATAAALAAAKTDATTKANNAKAEAITAAATDATTKANNAKAEAIADATTKYGGLPNRVTAVEEKNVEQDERLSGLEGLRPVKAVRYENGAWIWDPANATHYVLVDYAGEPVVRSTPWPIPNPTKPEFTW